MADVKVVTARSPRWDFDTWVSSSDGLDPVPDRAVFLGGSEDGDGDYDLYFMHFDGDADDQHWVGYLRGYETGDDDDSDTEQGWESSHEDISQVSTRSPDILLEAVRRSGLHGLIPVTKRDRTWKDLQGAPELEMGEFRHHIESPNGTPLDHTECAFYLGSKVYPDGLHEFYVVPRYEQEYCTDRGGAAVLTKARVYSVNKDREDGSWWEDRTVPTTPLLREAARRAFYKGIAYEFSEGSMVGNNIRDKCNFPNDNPYTNETDKTEESKETEMTTSVTSVTINKKSFKDVGVQESADEQIHLPKGMSKSQAREWLAIIEKNEEQVITWSECIDAYPLDGALALNRVLQRRFGTAVKTGATQMTWFGEKDIPPFMVPIEVALGKTEHVPWGHFIIPVMAEHKIKAGIEVKEGQLYFQLTGQIKRKYQPLMDEIASQVKSEVKTGSIYKSQAFRLKCPTEEQMESETYNPHDWAPKFIHVAGEQDELIFSDAVRLQIEVNLFTPVLHTEACRKAGIPLKRGVLLEGKYGTGKTLTASILSRHCVENGWTFVYLNDVTDLEKAMRFAKRYEPAVIFAEDIDSVMVQKSGSQRDVAMNQILNCIDGVDMKKSEQMVVLTSNFVDRINKAMLRPGRLDAVIHVEPPDTAAVLKLMGHYSDGKLKADDVELVKAATLLAGQIPSLIREVVERSKLASILRAGKKGTPEITGADILVASHGIMTHIRLLEEPVEDARSDMEKAAEVLVKGLSKSSPSNGATSKLMDAPASTKALSAHE